MVTMHAELDAAVLDQFDEWLDFGISFGQHGLRKRPLVVKEVRGDSWAEDVGIMR